jgi:hypothetical protein
MKNIMICALFGGMLLTGGCLKKEPVSLQETSRMNLPSDLRKMQGRWISLQEGHSVTAFVEGYTLRLTYESEGDELFWKKNVCIRETSLSQGKFEVYGEKEPWFYFIQKEGDSEELSLRFYDESRRVWISSLLQQVTRETDRVADL